MYKIKILTVGKTKETWLDEAIQEYVKRLKPQADVEFLLAKNEEQLIDWADHEASAICLDEKGNSLSSEEFSQFLLRALENGGSRLTFIIGGAEGLPSHIKKRYPLISLSPMTFTHQIARLILLEQIYRALEIAKGSKYHK